MPVKIPKGYLKMPSNFWKVLILQVSLKSLNMLLGKNTTTPPKEGLKEDSLYTRLV